MTKKWIAINLINVVLLVSAVMFGRHVRDLIYKSKYDNDPKRIQAKDNRTPQNKGLPLQAPPKNYNSAEFSIIPEKTIFSETRTNKEEAAPVVAPPPEIPPLTVKPILVGTSISDSQQRALIFDPTIPQDKGRRAQSKRVGDTYQGYTITQITSENIVLEAGTRKEIIPLHEGSKKGKSAKTPIQATRVMSFSGTGAGGVVGSGAASAGGSPRPGSTQAAANPPNVPPGQTPAVPAAAPPQGSPQPQQQPPGSGRVVTRPDGRRVIQTPFGEVVR
jgi:hypothetical protein